jgi:thiol:disulfide interchange protein/DsbC/DsbD-like thiol-disulfide interchange protein
VVIIRVFTRQRWITAAAAAVLAFFSATPAGECQLHEGRELVQAQVVANTTAIQPGKRFTVGVLLRQAPKWHTYWRYSGDAGLPTTIQWKLPAGWKVGEIQWPIARKLVEPGDIHVYGYYDEVLLRQEITPPDELSESEVQLTASVDWLVCEKICIPGGAELHLQLPIGGTPAAANEELFSRFERQLPQPWPADEVAQATWSREANQLVLRISSRALAAHPAVEFHPLPPEGAVIGHPAVSREDDAVVVRIPIVTEQGKLTSMDGLVVFGQTPDGAERVAWTLGSAAAPPMAEAIQLSADFATILQALLFGFVGGFILNLMPCVLPVISLKIFGFVQHAGSSRRRILMSGLSFVAGIFVWFIGLALLLIALKTAGREVAWAYQFTNPYFVLTMSAVVLVFALNMFGVFEINLPQTASRGILGWTTREGDAGAFFQGVFATILATPCTAPFLGYALGFALMQPAWVIMAMFLAIAAGMGAPYVLLSAKPAWLRFLPKPGAWMERVKQFMGFLLMATLLFLLYVVGAERGTDAVIWASCFLLVLSIACWMKGAFLTPLASGRSRAVTWLLIVALVLGGGHYFIGDKFAHAQLPDQSGQVQLSGGWQPFSSDRLEAELAAGRAVFIDFTAAWCVTCKFNKATVLDRADVQEAFDRRGVVRLQADWTNGDPEITRILKQFGRPGVPLYVLYPAGKSLEPIVLPELLTRNIVLDSLERVPVQLASEQTNQ